MTKLVTESGQRMLDDLRDLPPRPLWEQHVAAIEGEAQLHALRRLLTTLLRQKSGLTVELSTGLYISLPDVMAIIREQVAATGGPTEGESRALDGNR